MISKDLLTNHAILTVMGRAKRIKLFIFLFSPLVSLYSASNFAASKEQLLDFRVIDVQYINNAVGNIDQLTHRFLGSSLKGTPQDLILLQRLLSEGRISRQSIALQQAAGIVLGQVLKNQKNLQWVRYKDKAGVSRALLIKETQEVIFPVSIISRRYKTGLDVDVQALYEKMLSFIEHARQTAESSDPM